MERTKLVCKMLLKHIKCQVEKDSYFTNDLHDLLWEKDMFNFSKLNKKFICVYLWRVLICLLLHKTNLAHLVLQPTCILRVVICIRNQVPGPGSKIHYPVPNPGNWYPVFALITDEKCNFGLPLYLLMWWLWLRSICYDFYTIFVAVRIHIWPFIYGLPVWKKNRFVENIQ